MSGFIPPHMTPYHHACPPAMHAPSHAHPLAMHPLPHMPPTTTHPPHHAHPLPCMPPAMYTPAMHAPCNACPLPCMSPAMHVPLPCMPPPPHMPPRGQNSWHTLLKILPCPKLRLRAVKILGIFFRDEQFICPINRLWREYLTTVSRWWSLHSPLQTAICARRIVKLILIAWALN